MKEDSAKTAEKKKKRQGEQYRDRRGHQDKGKESGLPAKMRESLMVSV